MKTNKTTNKKTRLKYKIVLFIFIYNNLKELPIYFGKTAQLMRDISSKFLEIGLKSGFNLVEFPEIMPAELVDIKFLEEDWKITKPKSKDKFVLTPEITAFYASLLGQNPGLKELRKILYISTCYRENRFIQLGMESISSTLESDIQIVKSAIDFARNLGLEPELYVNDLTTLKKTTLDSGVSQNKVSSLLKEVDNQYLESVPERLKKIFYENKYPVMTDEFQEFLTAIPEAKLKTSLARGLNYYNAAKPRESTIIFEMYLQKIQVCGGGRYDGLMSSLNPILKNSDLDKGIGFAFGLERIVGGMQNVF